jgi:membrane protease YdiL (CAAX protease family)
LPREAAIRNTGALLFANTMATAPLPIVFLLLVWLPALGTGITHALVMHSRSGYVIPTEQRSINNEFSLAILIYGSWTVAAGLLMLRLLGSHGIPLDRLRIDGAISAVDAAVAVVTAVASIGLWWGVEVVLRRMGHGMFRVSAVDTSRWARPSAPELLILAVVGSLLIPLAEEILFRGYLLTAATEFTGSAVAGAAITALAFAAIHFYYGPGVMLYAAFMSAILSALAILTGTILPCVVAHGLVNLWSFVIVPLGRRGRPE